MRKLDPTEYIANTDIPIDDERFGAEGGTLTGCACPACSAPLPDLTDLLDDCGRASGRAFVECPACEAPIFLETEILVYAFTARREPTPPIGDGGPRK